jgi:hypothetical protein
MWSKLVDMELDDESQLDYPTPIAMDKPQYPCGLRICLTQEELTKLGLDLSCEIGDYLHIKAFATVTSISIDEDKQSGRCRVELQIEKMAVEDEGAE